MPGRCRRKARLLPETYLFTRGTTRAAAAGARCARRRRNSWPRTGPAAPPDLPFQTTREAVILASIVEKETALPEERRHIASVFVNRLKAGMKLQSDPTIIYGLTKGYPLGRGIRESEIEARHALQHLCDRRPAAGPDLQSRQGCHRRRAQSASRATICISSPPARAAMSSPPPWPSMQRNVIAYRAAGAAARTARRSGAAGAIRRRSASLPPCRSSAAAIAMR